MVQAGLQWGMGLAGHRHGGAVAAGLGSGNGLVPCCLRAGTGAVDEGRHSPGSGGDSGTLLVPADRFRHYNADRVRLAVDPEGAAADWVPHLDYRVPGGATQTMAGSDYADRIARHGPPADNTSIGELPEPSP